MSPGTLLVRVVLLLRLFRALVGDADSVGTVVPRLGAAFFIVLAIASESAFCIASSIGSRALRLENWLYLFVAVFLIRGTAGDNEDEAAGLSKRSAIMNKIRSGGTSLAILHGLKAAALTNTRANNHIEEDIRMIPSLVLQ